jgi:hypothetical protein
MTQLGADITLPVSMFEKCCFGGIVPTKDEYKAAFNSYKLCWKLLAKGKRPEKPQKMPRKAPKTV